MIGRGVGWRTIGQPVRYALPITAAVAHRNCVAGGVCGCEIAMAGAVAFVTLGASGPNEQCRSPW